MMPEASINDTKVCPVGHLAMCFWFCVCNQLEMYDVDDDLMMYVGYVGDVLGVA